MFHYTMSVLVFHNLGGFDPCHTLINSCGIVCEEFFRGVIYNSN